MKLSRFQWETRPRARKENICQGTTYRFTVLTDCLIRLEYSADGHFEDRASQSVFFRDLPKTSFSICEKGEWLFLETEKLQLRYQQEQPFSAETLQIQLKSEPASLWHFGEDFEDLGGTTKTLDEVNGARPLDRGVCSRNGFSVLDDSDTLVLEEDGWVGVRPENGTDVYFFGYGFEYRKAVQDFYKLTGPAPMLPAYALGNWWSRYHAYTQQEYMDLIMRFQHEDVPFSVSVIDMDWHVTKIPKDQEDADPRFRDGWTGYTWNEELFPDYRAFLKFLKDQNLHVTLNLHPHAGVCRHEQMYPQLAKALGMNPEDGDRIPIDLLSEKFMELYFDILHHPYEEDGVDFWWVDWQQGTNYWWIHEANTPGNYRDPKERMDPLWMLNHLHVKDISRNGKRPMYFSRYAGPGSHRYSIGFSGDSFVTWDSLKFQPYFTATASNIGYSWWSHDIGGHQRGYCDDELFVRWVQLGVFSPILRLHSMNSEFQRKEPWSYGQQTEQIVKKWLRFRHSLFPYLYPMAYRNHTEGKPMVEPMYYAYPKHSGAYEVPNQYNFGTELMVSPITDKVDTHSRLGQAEVWLPKGNWFDFFSGIRYASKRGRKMRIHRPLDGIPLFAKAGAIVPLADFPQGENRLTNSSDMQILVFPGESNVFRLFEDSGEGYDFLSGGFATTELKLTWGEKAVFTIGPVEGDNSLIPEQRNWTVMLRGWHQDIQIAAEIDGRQEVVCVRYDEQTNTHVVTLDTKTSAEVRLFISGDTLLHDNGDVYRRCERILQHSQMNIPEKEYLMREIVKEQSLHRKIYQITGRYRETESVVAALIELLSLTQDEYLGNQAST